MTAELTIREARDDDAAGLIALIGGVYAEYPGCVLDVAGEEPDLLGIASAYGNKGGGFWVSHDPASGELVGCVGWLPSAAQLAGGVWIALRKLYVARTHRRRGLATALCARVEAAAREQRAVGIELWSDTRFLDAHCFYAGRGYRQQPGTRELFDLSQSLEYHFLLPLGDDA